MNENGEDNKSPSTPDESPETTQQTTDSDTDRNRGPGHVEARAEATAEVQNDITVGGHQYVDADADVVGPDQDQDDRPESPPNRTASISRDPSGEARGAAVWLNADELAAIGIDVDDTDAVEVHVVDGDLRLVPAGGDGSR
jgi:hypothetical protein